MSLKNLVKEYLFFIITSVKTTVQLLSDVGIFDGYEKKLF